jgi:hypothetical protein
MTQRVRILEVGVAESLAYEIATEDGPGTTWHLYLRARAEDGREFAHPEAFWRSRAAAAERLAARVRARGSIDPEVWNELEPEMPLEERWALMGRQEHEVRLGLRAEADLYHGIPVR